MSSLLQVRQLCKGYRSGNGRIEVLVDLGLELTEGEMVAVTGVSGSGKSTLLHLLGGMDRADRGSIQVLGQEITSMDLPQLSRFRNATVGFVFQFHHLLPEFSALENVMMPLLLRGVAGPKASETGSLLLSEVGLAERGHHRPGELSGGEQQRVALARALAGNPRLLLADEPTGNLDSHTGEAIGNLFLELHQKRGLTSVMVTHNEKLAAICTSVYRLENGSLSKH